MLCKYRYCCSSNSEIVVENEKYRKIITVKFIKLSCILISSILFFSISACKESVDVKLNNYQLIPQDSLLIWVQEKRFPKPRNVKYLDSLNIEFDKDSLYKILNPRDIKLSYYWNRKQQIKYIKLTSASLDDKRFFDKMTKIENSNFNGNKDIITLVDVDCKRKGEILDGVFKRSKE